MASRPTARRSVLLRRHRHLSSPRPPPATTISHLLFLFRHRFSSATIISLFLLQIWLGAAASLVARTINTGKSGSRRRRWGSQPAAARVPPARIGDGAHPTSDGAWAPEHLAAVSRLPLPAVTSSCTSSLPSPPPAQKATAMLGTALQPQHTCRPHPPRHPSFFHFSVVSFTGSGIHGPSCLFAPNTITCTQVTKSDSTLQFLHKAP